LRSNRRRALLWIHLHVVLLIGGAGCAYNMSKQPRYNPYSKSDFFPDERSVRPVVEGTIARGGFHANNPFFTGKKNGQVVDQVPVRITLDMLNRGRERYDIYCSPCHGRVGDGEGMVVQRGFDHPPSYMIDRLRQAQDGHFFDVITNGVGRMSSYASRVDPADRWAIVAYIRALQLSQSATIKDVPPEELQKLK